MKWRYKIFHPVNSGTFNEELDDCIQQFNSYIEEGDGRYKVVLLNIFIEGINLDDFQKKRVLIANSLVAIKRQQFIFEILPQKPAGSKLVMKAMCFDSSVYPATLNLIEAGSLRSLEINFDDAKTVLFSTSSFGGNIANDSHLCFQQTEEKLKSSGLNFNNVVRQWNYIGGIIQTSIEGGELEQNYQSFNDTRSHFYKHVVFTNGFPAATGIGMDLPGIIIQTVACRFSDNSEIAAINNPQQIPAHRYSNDVLIGKSCDLDKATPKFERAKAVISENGSWIFVSGTAAIKGEQHTRDNNVDAQTIETLELIKELVSQENLKKNGINQKTTLPKAISFRAYVKYEEDVEVVKSRCRQFFGDIPAVILIADICRDALLVEIECEFEI